MDLSRPADPASSSSSSDHQLQRSSVSDARVPRTRNLPSLTGLRFIAALMVLGSHVDEVYFPDVPLLRVGAVGVSFFFVLSGFVLAWSWAPARGRGDFYRRRFARVVPLHVVTWVIALLLSTTLGNPSTVLGWVTSLLLLQAWFVIDIRTYFGGNGPSWSLSCEAFFYAVFPFLAVVLLRRDRKTLWWVVVGVASGAYVVTLLGEGLFHRNSTLTAVLYVFPVYRIWEFVLGIALARLVALGAFRPSLRLAGGATVLVFVLACVVDDLLHDHVGPLAQAGISVLPLPLASLALVPCFFALIAAAAARNQASIPTWLRSRLLVTLGKWSFALYLSHLFVLELVRLALGSHPAAVVLWGGAVGAAVVAVLLSGVLYRGVEMPLERLLRPRRDRARVD